MIYDYMITQRRLFSLGVGSLGVSVDVDERGGEDSIIAVCLGSALTTSFEALVIVTDSVVDEFVFRALEIVTVADSVVNEFVSSDEFRSFEVTFLS